MGYLMINADALVAYGTIIFLIVDIVALVLIGVFTQRICTVSSQKDMESEGVVHFTHPPVNRLHPRQWDIAVNTSDWRH
jgi:hypothetical protein